MTVNGYPTQTTKLIIIIFCKKINHDEWYPTLWITPWLKLHVLFRYMILALRWRSNNHSFKTFLAGTSTPAAAGRVLHCGPMRLVSNPQLSRHFIILRKLHRWVDLYTVYVKIYIKRCSYFKFHRYWLKHVKVILHCHPRL